MIEEGDWLNDDPIDLHSDGVWPWIVKFDEDEFRIVSSKSPPLEVNKHIVRRFRRKRHVVNFTQLYDRNESAKSLIQRLEVLPRPFSPAIRLRHIGASIVAQVNRPHNP